MKTSEFMASFKIPTGKNNLIEEIACLLVPSMEDWEADIEIDDTIKRLQKLDNNVLLQLAREIDIVED